ncbi:MAG: hypothetical protein H7318_20480 [Oligoflexus sp.]|nr:hypothetical protein [Oligoflexus sp.]
MRLIFFIVLFLSREAFAASSAETLKFLSAPETLLVSTAIQAGLVFLLFSFAIFFFIAARQANKLDSNIYLSMICMSAALLCFLGSKTLRLFYFGEGLRIGSVISRQIESAIMIVMLMGLAYLINDTYRLRIRRKNLLGLLVMGSVLTLSIGFVPSIWIQVSVLILCLPFIILLLFLSRGRQNLGSLLAGLGLIQATLYDCFHEFLDLGPHQFLLSPYLAFGLALTRIGSLKFLFELSESQTDLILPLVRGTASTVENLVEMDASEDPEIIIEINKRSVESFSLFMDALHNTLFQMTSRLQKTLTRQDDQLKELYVHAKTIEVGARSMGYKLLSNKIERLSSSLVQLVQNLDGQWNPITMGQEIEAVRKAGRQYLRLNSKIVGRRLEWAAKTSFDRDVKNLRNEDPNHQLPELKRAADIALASFEEMAWTDLRAALQTITNHALRERKISSEARLVFEAPVDSVMAYALNYKDLPDLRTMLDRIVDNAVKHGFESSYERLWKHKSAISEIHLSINETTLGIVFRIQDDGRGLGIRRLREWAHEDPLLDKDKGSDLSYYAKLLTLKAWQAPRGLSEVSRLAEKMDLTVDIVLFPERILNGHCPFAIEILFPLHRLKSRVPAPLYGKAG